MKAAGILHGALSELVAVLGHGDQIIISDYGLPVPNHIRLIDLAVKPGVPDFLTVLETVLKELCVESYTVADELRELNPEYLAEIKKTLQKDPAFVSHNELKEQSKSAKAVIRTGEFTPYANVILTAGVPF